MYTASQTNISICLSIYLQPPAMNMPTHVCHGPPTAGPPRQDKIAEGLEGRCQLIPERIDVCAVPAVLR